MENPSAGWLARRSLRELWILPLAVALPAAIAAIGYVAYTSAERSVAVLGDRLLLETALRVNQHLNQYLSLPHQVTALNLAAARQGLISPQDLTAMGKFFWQQQQTFGVSYVNFGSVNREFIGAGVNPNGEVFIDEVKAPALDRMVLHRADKWGNRLAIDEVIPANPVDGEWYTEALEAEQPIWTSIYAWNDDRRVLAISASAPYRDARGQLQGVFGVDLLLADIGRFLQSLELTPHGRVFVLEPSGMLVASSAAAPVSQLVADRTGEAALRLAVDEYADPLVRDTGRLLRRRYADLQAVLAPEQFQETVGEETVWVRVTPFSDAYGLNWLGVVVVPARDLLGTIPQIVTVAVAVGGMGLGGAVLLGWAIAGRIARPLRQLSQAATAIAAGDWEATVPLTGTREIRALAGAYNEMAHQLQTAFGELEQRVAERTQALVRNERRLRQLNQALRELAGQAVLCQGERRPAYRIITETAAQALEVERASLWFYDVAHTHLVCETLYEHSYHLTSWGWELRAADYPALWAAIAEAPLVSIEDATVDARTRDEAASYFRPLGITSVLLLPVRHRQQRLGFLMLEHQGAPRTWLEEELGFARSLTDLTALAIASSERRQVERALQEAKEAAEAANAAKSDFLSNMSHELRTPLNGILGYAQILQRDGGLTEEQKVGLNTIYRCGQHLLNLINDVLDFAKIEAQKLELEPSAFHLGLCLESLLDMCRLRAEQKGLGLRYEPDPRLPIAICSDEKRLRQVLLNLLGNAIKFTAVGEVSLAVTVVALGDRRCTLRFTVSDTGVGIPPDRL
ncbi:MAG: histidine kinase dimerization/phospho-acceptor domain-containing protein, partial [Pseudanabaenaceae cyanobacterium]